MDRLSKGQEEGFAALATAMAQQGRRLEELLGDVRTVVVETHSAVLDLQGKIEGQTEQVRQVGQAVQKLLEQHQLQRRELRPGDSLSIRSDTERQLVKQLVARYRALPEGDRKGVPALLNAVGKLEVVAGDFDAAQKDFQTVALLEQDDKAQAEAHHNAFLASLAKRDWTEAMQELVKAIKLDGKRFAPFPVGKYQPVRILGAGGFGVAFLCKHKYMDAQVVVKTLGREDLGRDADKVFMEAQVLRQLDHPAIIRTSDCGYVDPAGKSRPFLVMDYFHGGTLEEYVKKHGPLPLNDLLAVVRPAAEGLQAAHGKGILHRDVKPANLLVRKEGTGWQVKVIDFGLAVRHKVAQATMNASTAKRGKTQVGDGIAGTIDYAAPEQMGRRKDPVGPYSDVYGWAKTCCYALFQTTQPLPKHWNSIPQPLAQLLERCLDEEPKNRPAGFREVLDGLKSVAAQDVQQTASSFDFGEPASPEPAHKPRPTSRPRSRRPLWPWLIGAGVALAAVLLLSAMTVFRVQTKAGTVVVEIDQAGAEISVDGNRITLTSPKDKEPIKIDVDEGAHQLKVTKGGFETVTKQFSLKAGETDTIKVRLEPVQVAQGPKKVEPQPDKDAKPEPATAVKNPTSTVAYYRFEEGEGTKVINSVDGSSEGSHNAIYSRETPATKIPLTGEENKFGLEFKGKETVSVRMPFVFNEGMGDGTLEFWVKVPDSRGNGTLFWGSTGKDDANRFHIFIDSGSLICNYRDTNGPGHDGHDLLVGPGEVTIPGNTWIHVAITRRGNAYRFYKDGVAVYTATDSKPALPMTTGWIMAGDGLRQRPFTGWIDEVRVSNKALQPSEFLNASPDGKQAEPQPDKGDKSKPPTDQFLSLSLEKAATADTTQPLYGTPTEVLIFPTWGEQKCENIPFNVVEPKDGRPNAIVLRAGWSGKYPTEASVPCGVACKAIHLLSGVAGGGWLPDNKGQSGVALVVRLHYADGSTEDHELLNGVHFANFRGMTEVPGSKLAFKLEAKSEKNGSPGGMNQVRYLAITPEKPTIKIDSIDFLKGEKGDGSSPIIMAVTVETATQPSESPAKDHPR